MNSHERMEHFFERTGEAYQSLSNFHIHRLEDIQLNNPSRYRRRDYYKIALLLQGEALVSYADRTIPINKPALIFSNPMIPYSWQRISTHQRGYFCLFTEQFVNNQLKNDSPAASPFFKVQGNHVLFPDQPATERITNIYDMMLKEAESDYRYKYDALRNYVQLLIHESLKITPPQDSYTRTTSAERITELFLELLARQFPVTTNHDRIRIKTAAGFAAQLSVHVNYLNQSVKSITGKTTTRLIAEHLAQEAKALLQHTNWDVAEIGYCLGFEHASNFNTFFRKMTGNAPNHLRR